MSSEAERQAFNVIAPKQSATSGEGVVILAAVTTVRHDNVPAEWLGRYVYLQAEGDKIWVNFSPTAAAATDIDKTKAGGATVATGTDIANAIPIPNGSRIPVRLSKGQHDVIKWQADAATSKLIIYPTTPKTNHRHGSAGP